MQWTIGDEDRYRMQPDVPQKLSPSADGIAVDSTHVIPRGELDVRVSRAGGAGGQHVNKTSTRVEIFWRPSASAALNPEERSRVLAKLSKRLDSEGLLRIVSSETRSQLRNREAAESRLGDIVRRALVVEKARRKTKPSRAAREKRLEEKKLHARKKDDRRFRDEG